MDQFRKGVKLVVGKTNNDLCSVTAILSYLARRGNVPGLLFQWDNHLPLSQSKFVNHVHQAHQQPTFLPPLLGTQFLDWGSNNSSLSRHQGLYHPDFGMLEKFSLSSLYSTQPHSSGKIISYHGSNPKLTSLSQHFLNILHVIEYHICLSTVLTTKLPNCNFIACLDWYGGMFSIMDAAT